MNRRGFLGFFGGAAVSAPSLARAAAGDAVLKQAGFAAGNGLVGASPMTVAPASTSVVTKAVKWIRRNGIPSWKMYDITRQADYQRRNGLDPDIASLVSVSPGWKARAQRKRNLDRAIETSIASIGRSGARNSFEQKMSKQFGDFVDWYDRAAHQLKRGTAAGHESFNRQD